MTNSGSAHSEVANWYDDYLTLYWYDQYTRTNGVESFRKYDPSRVTRELLGLDADVYVIYAVSHDYNVYALTEVQPSSKAANFLWKVSLESVIADSPVSIGERLYVNTVSKGLFAMEKADGSILWNVPQGQRVLAAGKKNVYVLMRGHRPRIGLVDFETGELKELIDARGHVLFTTNTVEPTLYMADRRGGVLALREWDAEVAAGGDEEPDEFEESGQDEQE